MGAAVAARLTENGVRVVTSLEGRSAASAKRAAAAGMTPVSEAEIAGADFVLSIVPPGEAQPLAERLKPALQAANRKPVYVDCNAVSPRDRRKASPRRSPRPTRPFVDGGIIGGPPRAGYNGPSIYVSGPDSGRVETLNQYGLRIRGMGGTVGDASALKMSYAGLTKGLIALGTAMVLAAERAGVGDALRAELAESQVAHAHAADPRRARTCSARPTAGSPSSRKSRSSPARVRRARSTKESPRSMSALPRTSKAVKPRSTQLAGFYEKAAISQKVAPTLWLAPCIGQSAIA